MDKKKVTSFWEWFLQNASKFSVGNSKEVFLNELDEWVFQLGNYSWEIGPGFNALYMFVLSPHGNKSLLKETKEIVLSAPKVENWEFFYAKQPIRANFKFVLYQPDGPFEFDASTWKYVLLKFPDNTFDIIIEAKNIQTLSMEDKDLAVRLAIDGMIGEEKRIELFGDIEIVENLSSEYKRLASGFTYLLEHLKKNFRSEFW